MDRKPVIYILASASLFGLSPPLAKLLMQDVSPIALAGLLYLGAFIGLVLYSLISRIMRSPLKKTTTAGNS